MLSNTLLVMLAAACFVMLCGVNVYLAITLIRGVRVEDKTIEELLRQSKYSTRELAALARLVRRVPAGAVVEETGRTVEGDSRAGSEEALQAAFDQFHLNGFAEFADGSLEAHGLISEMAELSGKQLNSWKAANQLRIEEVAAAQGSLQARLEEARQMLDAAHGLIQQLRARNSRLSGADAKAKALDAINQGLEAELAAAKSASTRLNAQAIAAQQKADGAEREVARLEAHYREKFDAYVRERQQLEKEKQATELRLDSLQRAFDQTVQELNQDKLLHQEHEKFLGQAQGLQMEKSDLERQLNELQENFNRALVEKAFIESVLLDFDSAMEPVPA